MQVHGVAYTEKAEAGKAIISACKEMTKSSVVTIGNYRGLVMDLEYSAYSQEFIITLKGSMWHKVTLSSDIHGNITRLDNAIARIEDKKIKCEGQLEDVKKQWASAEQEVKKEFKFEGELTEKMERLGELNVLLDMDKQEEVLTEDNSIAQEENKIKEEIVR